MSRPTQQKTTCPEHLTGDGKAFWLKVMTDYDIRDPAGQKLLRLAAESLMQIDKCNEMLKTEGFVFVDRWGQPRKHPAADVLRDSQATFSRLCRELRLDPPTEGSK